MLNGAPTRFFGAQRGLRQGDPMSPMLFALYMDYLDRVMSFIGEQYDFRFHEWCKDMNLTHICFVDDILLLCNGDFRFIIKCFRGFSCSQMHVGWK